MRLTNVVSRRAPTGARCRRCMPRRSPASRAAPTSAPTASASSVATRGGLPQSRRPRPGGRRAPVAGIRGAHRRTLRARLSRPTGEQAGRRAARRLQLEVAQHHAPEHDHIAVAQLGLLDALPVDERAVRAAVIEDPARRLRRGTRIACRRETELSSSCSPAASPRPMWIELLAERDQQRLLAGPAPRDSGPARRSAGGRALAHALVQARDRVEPLGEPVGGAGGSLCAHTL